MSADNNLKIDNSLRTGNARSDRAKRNKKDEKKGRGNILDGIKIVLLVILLFSMVIGLTFAALYLTNKSVKGFVDRKYSDFAKKKEEKQITEVKSDTRVSELADYYLTLGESESVTRLQNIKSKDKKLYGKIQSAMDVIEPNKSQAIKTKVNEKKDKSAILEEEYNNMLEEKESTISTRSGFYGTLGIRGAIDYIEDDLVNNMDYDRIANTLEKTSPDQTVKILYYMDPIYVDGIKNRFSQDYLRQIEEGTKTYQEFLRVNESLGKLYGKMKPDLAMKDLADEDKFNQDQVATILTNMNYLEAAKILFEFEDENKVNEILSNIRNIEDYQVQYDGNLSAVIANSLKVLKKFDEDVDIIKKAYEKMKPEDLADIMDKHFTNEPRYRTYKIDEKNSFKITEKEMAIDALKLIKPQLVADMLSELKNTKRIDKAVEISREIGIPLP